MRFNRFVVLTVLFIPSLLTAQIKVTVQQSKLTVEEKADTEAVNVYIDILVSDTNSHLVHIIDTHTGDASSLDYSIQQPLNLYASSQTPKVQSFPITIFSDAKEEPDENIVLDCEYSVRKKDNLGDSSIVVADTIVIKDYKKPEKSKKQDFIYSKRFYGEILLF
jgi:hypothetical protein